MAQTIRMITNDPNVIEEKLEAHEADIDAVEMSNQASTAFLSNSQPPMCAGRGIGTYQPGYSNRGRIAITNQFPGCGGVNLHAKIVIGQDICYPTALHQAALTTGQLHLTFHLQPSSIHPTCLKTR